MRELKLRYFIELASNIGTKARSEAQAVEQSQRTMQSAVDKTSGRIQALDSAYARFAANSATERQIGYMRRLGQGIDQVSNKMRGLVQLTAKGLQNAPAAVAGVAAGVYAAKTMLDKPIDYSTRLARISNTTFNDRDKAGRSAGKAELNEAVMSAVRKGGGSRDDAATALNELVASNSVNYEEAKNLLPTLTMGASGSGASAVQLSQIAIRAKQNLQIPLDQLPALLDEANAAGKAGGFELDNMAKSLPQALAMGRQSGLTGREGFRKIVAMMQASVITAGTKDEAANNVVNLLGKLNSDDTKKDFAKQGIDLRSELVKGRANGVDSVDTFVGLVDKIAGKDKNYTELKAKLDNTTDKGERSETMSSMADILQGKAIGAVVQDRQALMSLVAVMNNRKYMLEIQQKMRDDKGSLGKDFDSISDETGFKVAKVGAEAENAQYMALNGKAGVLNKLLDGTASLAQEFPNLAVAATGATMALGILATSAGLFGFLLRKNAGGPVLPPGPGGGPFGKVGSPGAFPTLDGAKPAAGSGAGGKVASGLRSLGWIGSALALGSELFMTSDEDLKTLAFADAKKAGISTRGKGYNDDRLLAATMPSIAEQAAALGPPQKLELGKGELAVNVRVTDERTTASATVTTPMSGVKVSAGATNPEGTW